MLALAVLFILSLYLSAIICKIFKFNQDTFNVLSTWVFFLVLDVVFSLMYAQEYWIYAALGIFLSAAILVAVFKIIGYILSSIEKAVKKVFCISSY